MNDPRFSPNRSEVEKQQVIEYVKNQFDTLFKLIKGTFLVFGFYLDFEKIELVAASDIGLPEIGSSVNQVSFARLKLRFNRSPEFETPTANRYFHVLYKMLGITGDYMDILSEFLDTNPASGSLLELEVVFKRVFVTDPMHEKGGYIDLNSKGIETLSVVFPTIDKDNAKVLDTDLIMTLAIQGRPLNSYSLEYLITEDENSQSILKCLMEILGSMHINRVIHGDAQLKNFLVKIDETNQIAVIPIDLESYLNFNTLDLRNLKPIEAKIMQKYQAGRESNVDLEILRAEAMLFDLERIFDGLTDGEMDEYIQEEIKKALEMYLQMLVEAGILNQDGYFIHSRDIPIPFAEDARRLVLIK